MIIYRLLETTVTLVRFALEAVSKTEPNIVEPDLSFELRAETELNVKLLIVDYPGRLTFKAHA